MKRKIVFNSDKPIVYELPKVPIGTVLVLENKGIGVVTIKGPNNVTQTYNSHPYTELR